MPDNEALPPVAPEHKPRNYEEAAQGAAAFREVFGNNPIISRSLIRMLGPSLAVLIRYLREAESVSAFNHELDEHGYCAFNTHLSHNLGLSPDELRLLRRQAEDLGLIHVQRDPTTECLYYKVDDDAVLKVVEEDMKRNDTALINRFLKEQG